MTDLLQRINSGEILIADGAMGTMLFERGLESGQCPERLNLDRIDILEDIAKSYLKAGADIVQTNTFGGSPLKLALYSLDARTEEINRNAVRAVRNAVGHAAYVSASCGPCGMLLLPYGDAAPDDVLLGFERQLEAITAEGVDMICIETMIDLGEATLAIKAAKRIAPSIPIAATMTFDSTPKGFFTIMGVSIQQAVDGLTEAGADIIGSNCGNGIENMVKIAVEYRRRTELPLIIQSNAGLPEMQDGKLIYRESPEFMAENCRLLIDAGVSIIGGCCGTTPAHISAFRRVVDSLRS
ncbi:MAG: homocysteine S-methyltransferase family protein [Candidatus Zixiibacteriota bacterium]